jgi:hypothetical protein
VIRKVMREKQRTEVGKRSVNEESGEKIWKQMRKAKRGERKNSTPSNSNKQHQSEAEENTIVEKEGEIK